MMNFVRSALVFVFCLFGTVAVAQTPPWSDFYSAKEHLELLQENYTGPETSYVSSLMTYDTWCDEFECLEGTVTHAAINGLQGFTQTQKDAFHARLTSIENQGADALANASFLLSETEYDYGVANYNIGMDNYEQFLMQGDQGNWQTEAAEAKEDFDQAIINITQAVFDIEDAVSFIEEAVCEYQALQQDMGL